MEKRRCVKTDTIMINMLIHALRDVFREEKKKGISTKDTADFILRLADYQGRKLYLSDIEYQKAIQALNGLRDAYIRDGRYTDCIDRVLICILKAKYKTYKETEKP